LIRFILHPKQPAGRMGKRCQSMNIGISAARANKPL
jgi:hypothetical protein